MRQTNDSGFTLVELLVTIATISILILDGLSSTLTFSEVKNYQVVMRDCGPLAGITDPNVIPPPDLDHLTLLPQYLGGGCTHYLTSHTQWPEMTVGHIGFTTVCPNHWCASTATQTIANQSS